MTAADMVIVISTPLVTVSMVGKEMIVLVDRVPKVRHSVVLHMRMIKHMNL